MQIDTEELGISPLSRLNKPEYMNKLIEAFGSTDTWFISGSFANEHVTRPNDIDIYFYNEEGYETVVRNLAGKKGHTETLTSSFAETYRIPDIYMPVQLIKKTFGTPQEIFDTMDLNVCKQALLPDFQSIADKTAFDPLTITTIDNICIDTFTRYMKYYSRANPKRNYDKAFIYLFDNFIENPTCVDSYYEKTELIPVNKLLFELFTKYKRRGTRFFSRPVQNKLTWLVQCNAPELLL